MEKFLIVGSIVLTLGIVALGGIQKAIREVNAGPVPTLAPQLKPDAGPLAPGWSYE